MSEHDDGSTSTEVIQDHLEDQIENLKVLKRRLTPNYLEAEGAELKDQDTGDRLARQHIATWLRKLAEYVEQEPAPYPFLLSCSKSFIRAHGKPVDGSDPDKYDPEKKAWYIGNSAIESFELTFAHYLGG